MTGRIGSSAGASLSLAPLSEGMSVFASARISARMGMFAILKTVQRLIEASKSIDYP
jgi:hypothetical protein